MDSRLLWGTVDMLILDVVSRGPTYGYQIAQSVLSQSRGYFELKEGSLYPALHRMERQGLLTAEWRTENGRRRRYYRLTDLGEKELARRRARWREFTAAMDAALREA